MMKLLQLLVLLLIPLSLIGCEEDGKRYEWVVERGNRSSDEIQRDFNTMGQYGWGWVEDDDLEESGYYIYFGIVLKPSKAQPVLDATAKAMNLNLDREIFRLNASKK